MAKLTRETMVTLPVMLGISILIILVTAVGMWNKGTGDRWTCQRMREWELMAEGALEDAGVDVDLPYVDCNTGAK